MRIRIWDRYFPPLLMLLIRGPGLEMKDEKKTGLEIIIPYPQHWETGHKARAKTNFKNRNCGSAENAGLAYLTFAIAVPVS